MSNADRQDWELPDDGRDLFDEPDLEAEEAALRRAEAEAAAGKGIPHEEVAAWLRTWGTPDEHPAPAHWFT